MNRLREIGHSNIPGFSVRWLTQSIDCARASMQKGTADPCIAQNLDSALDGVTFSNRAQIEHHPFALKTDGEGAFIKVNEVHSCFASSFGNFFGCGQTAFASHESPAFDQRRNSNIKSAFSFLS